jgi:putative flippase GtrA
VIRRASASARDALTGTYDKHGEKIRYLVVGGWNTVFSIVLFNVGLWLFPHMHYLAVFWAAWVFAVVQSTVTMKYFAFRSAGHVWHQVGRAYVIYLPAQGLSTLLLWLVVVLLTNAHVAHGVAVRLAQLAAIGVSTVFSYVGHKYFTFRVPLDVVEVAPADMIEGRDSSS